MSSLYVQLPAAPVTEGTEFAYVASDDGRTPVRSGQAAATLLPPVTGTGAEVVAIVPAAALSWHRFDWPKGVAPNSPRLRAVLEGLLEDQLLDEPESVHFAVEAGARAGDTAWVAACDRAWLRGALAVLDAAGRPASRLVPEVAPEAPAMALAMGDPDAGLLCVRGPDGVLLLPLAPSAQALLPALPDDALCLAEPAVAAQAEQLLQRPVVLQPAPQRWLQAAQTRWNLAQFDFTASGRARTVKRLATAWGEVARAPQWRAVRWGLVLLVAVNLIGLNAWAWRERQALDAKRAAVRGLLTQTFPQVRVVVDAPVQMAREVAALRQATGTPGPADLETLLGALAALAPGRTVSAVDYAAGTLRVRGLGWDEAALRAAAPSLRGQGLAATLEGDVLVLRPEGPR